jgi:hypothetical protein
MTIKIEISGDTLHTSDEVILCCWEDRASGLLSRAAGLALMPYLNESERAEAVYQRELDRYEYGDPAAPDAPASLYEYFVDGEVAFPGKEVKRDPCAIVFDDGEPTGRVYMTTLSETMRLLERK